MASLTSPEKPKKGKQLPIIIALVVVIVVIAAVLGYLYMDDQNKKSQKREELKQIFGDRQNETNRLYEQISGYPGASNKNYVDDFQKWVEGYRKLADSYSLAVESLVADGATYQCMLANESTDYAGVTQTCNAARDKARAVNSTAAGYEREYLGRLGLKANATAAYQLALGRSHSLYQTAWGFMQDNANSRLFDSYLAYLRACDQNNTLYNNSIALAESAGATYQTYLKGDEYYDVNTTVAGLHANASKLGNRYAELRKTTVQLSLINEEVGTAWSADLGLYKTATFYVRNDNRANGTLPNRAWNVVVHYKLFDVATGAVRSTDDVEVPEFSGNISPDFYRAILPCDQGREYRTEYTITFDY